MPARMVCWTLALLVSSCAAAQTAAPPPAAEPAGAPAAQPAPAGPTGSVQLAAGSSLENVLDALHQRGEGLQNFVADVSLAETDGLTGDTTTLLGKAWYQARDAGNARLRVLFDTKKIGQRIDKQARVEYLLADGWLIDRDYRRKIQVDRQVLQPGQKMDLLKLGEGPFPLPIGQPREEVLKLFEAKKVDAQPGDPPNSVHIQLIPRPGTQFHGRFKAIEVWVDTENRFPKRIAVNDIRQKSIRTTDLSNVQVNTGLADSVFALEKVEGWTRRSEKLEE